MRKRREIPVRSYREVRKEIRSGDLLSYRPCCSWYRPWSYWTWLIALTNKYRISHTAMACWWDKNLLVVQMTASPTRIVLLSEDVRNWPGKITVSRPLAGQGFKRLGAVDRMVRITEKPYGWMRILLLGLTHTLTGGLLWPNPGDDDKGSKWPPVCSEAYSRSMRLSGFDPVIGRADSRTEPHHLFESNRMKPLFTLIK